MCYRLSIFGHKLGFLDYVRFNTTRKHYNNDQLIQQDAFLVVKISIITTRRKTGHVKYYFLQRVYYLVVNIPKPVVNELKILAKKKAGPFPARFWEAKAKRRRL